MPQRAPVTNNYARHVLARLVDFFTDEGTPWPRRLWDIGSILALEELWEASSWQAAGVLSQSACDWQRNELRAVIGPDVGLGERELRREVTEILSNPLTESSAALAALDGTSARAVAIEPFSARCLGAAQEGGEPVDVPVSGPAVDSLGVRRVGRLAFDAALAHDVEHVDVTDDAIIQAQLRAWEELRVGLEAGGAAALAALLSGAYVPAEREVAGVLACGGNVDIAAVLAAAA